jgi:hypothetical protein
MESWVSFFVIVACLAIVLQMAILAGMFFAVKKTTENLTRVSNDVSTKLLPVLEKTNFLLEDSRTRISSVVSDVAEIVHIARNQANRFDRVAGEGVEVLRSQIARADQVITGALETVEEVHGKLRKSVTGPVTQVTAVLRGIKAGLDFFAAGKSGKDDQPRSQSEEELFI